MYRGFKQFAYQLLVPLIRLFKYISWHYYLNVTDEIRIIIGAGPTKYKGWFATDIETLDITKRSDFQKYFSKRKISKVLAEHVLEHLTDKELKMMIENLFNYSGEDINIRIAVPDGYHPSVEYINSVKPGGKGEGAFDHKNLFTVVSLSVLFEKYGFTPHPIEYWDEKGVFHEGYLNDDKGYIKRSFINDARNILGKHNYTSLIIDFTK